MEIKEPATSALLSRLSESAARPLEQARSLPAALYRSEDVQALERTQIFRRAWVCAGLAAEIPNHGDYLTFTIADEPVFCTRSKDGGIKTFANVCRHRMMRLVEGSGSARRIVCPYHAWTYSLDGKLVGAGHMEKSCGFKKSDHRLPEIRTEIWNGWIYLTLDDNAASVAELLAPLHELVGRYEMENYIPVVQQEHVWETDWKLLTENFMESYHLPVAHKATVGQWLPVETSRFPPDTYDGFTYQTFIKTGNAVYGLAHENNTRLTDEWRYTSVMPTVFPAHMYVLAPDHLWYLTLRPKGMGKVSVRFGAAIAPEVDAALDDREAWVADLVSFFDHVNDEDRFVVEGIYAGAQSGFAAPGPLSWLERELHDFQRYLARQLSDPIGETT